MIPPRCNYSLFPCLFHQCQNHYYSCLCFLSQTHSVAFDFWHGTSFLCLLEFVDPRIEVHCYYYDCKNIDLALSNSEKIGWNWCSSQVLSDCQLRLKDLFCMVHLKNYNNWAKISQSSFKTTVNFYFFIFYIHTMVKNLRCLRILCLGDLENRVRPLFMQLWYQSTYDLIKKEASFSLVLKFELTRKY